MATVKSHEAVWNDLKLRIIHLYERKTISRANYMTMHSLVYQYCATVDTKAPGKAFHELARLISELLREILSQQAQACEGLAGEELLRFYTVEWVNFKLLSTTLDKTCSFMNSARHFDETLIPGSSVYTTYHMAVLCWKDIMLNKVQKRITSASLAEIDLARNGQIINTTFIRGLVGCLMELGLLGDGKFYSTSREVDKLSLYRQHFETPYILSAERFYGNASTEFLNQNSIMEYAVKVPELLVEEHKRGALILHSSSLQLLMRACEKILIGSHLDCLQEELKALFLANKTEEFVKLFKLIARPDDPLSETCSLVEKQILKDEFSPIEALGWRNDPGLFVTSIINAIRNGYELVQRLFNNDARIKAAVDKSIGNIINQHSFANVSKSNFNSAQLLARYSDVLLKRSKRNQDDELAENFENLISILEYLDDKDVFEKYYRKLLAKRLVSQVPVNEDAELIAISQLKMTCGIGYASKIQKMMTDMMTSKNLNEEFKIYVKENASTSTAAANVHINVFSSGSWPFTQHVQLGLPSEMEQSVNTFTRFYNTKYSGRKLIWLFHHSTCDIESNGFKKRHIFHASAYQSAILIMFNSNDAYRIRELMEASKLTIDLLIQVIRSLIKAKLLVAQYGENEDDLTENTLLSLPKDYTNNKVRVNIIAPLKTEVNREQQESGQQIEDERKFTIQAAIVRIMKTRKRCHHQELLKLVINDLGYQFKPSVKLIKKCIDILVEKDYMERIGEKLETFSYLP